MDRNTGIRKSGVYGMYEQRAPNVEQGAWIHYQLKLRDMIWRSVAAQVGVSPEMCRQVAYGLKTSARVQKAIAAALGFKEWRDLAAARQGVAA
jgi:hypothetical protein